MNRTMRMIIEFLHKNKKRSKLNELNLNELSSKMEPP